MAGSRSAEILEGTALVNEVALDITPMTATRRRFIGILVGSMATVAAAGSVAG